MPQILQEFYYLIFLFRVACLASISPTFKYYANSVTFYNSKYKHLLVAKLIKIQQKAEFKIQTEIFAIF
jgi:hypothetical protein